VCRRADQLSTEGLVCACCDFALNRERNVLELVFNVIRHSRAIGTRYEIV
jgi:hypothetical protein